MSQEHTIHEIADGEADIFYQNDGNVLAEIDWDEDAEIPIFAYATKNGAHTVFCIPEEGDTHIRVLFTTATRFERMSDMIDVIVKRFGINELVFFNVMNVNLLEKLNNISTRTIEADGMKVVVGDVVWEV